MKKQEWYPEYISISPYKNLEYIFLRTHSRNTYIILLLFSSNLIESFSIQPDRVLHDYMDRISNFQRLFLNLSIKIWWNAILVHSMTKTKCICVYVYKHIYIYIRALIISFTVIHKEPSSNLRYDEKSKNFHGQLFH